MIRYEIISQECGRYLKHQAEPNYWMVMKSSMGIIPIFGGIWGIRARGEGVRVKKSNPGSMIRFESQRKPMIPQLSDQTCYAEIGFYANMLAWGQLDTWKTIRGSYSKKRHMTMEEASSKVISDDARFLNSSLRSGSTYWQHLHACSHTTTVMKMADIVVASMSMEHPSQSFMVADDVLYADQIMIGASSFLFPR